ncbi:dermonecrotic toxin domain-containing protein, partial [Burkholderia ambifaria]|uniref:dermonecrotic toxin domain-containing protein n=1 Tax=Burkholderia ambifaria TaxID=152480 RepID=UPI0012FE0CEE
MEIRSGLSTLTAVADPDQTAVPMNPESAPFPSMPSALPGDELATRPNEPETPGGKRSAQETSKTDHLSSTFDVLNGRVVPDEADERDDVVSLLSRQNTWKRRLLNAPPSFSAFSKQALKRELDKQFPGQNLDPDKTYVVQFEDKTKTDSAGERVPVRTTTQSRSLTDEFQDSFKNGRTPTYKQGGSGIYRTPVAEDADRIGASGGPLRLEKAIDDARSNLKSDFQKELRKYWDEPGVASLPRMPRKECLWRSQGALLERIAELGELDGTLTKADLARVSQLTLYSDSAERVDEEGQPTPDMPGVYAISVPNASAPSGKTEFSGMYIITEKPIAEELDASTDVGTVLLSMPGRPLERFDSLNALNTGLSLRLADPDQRRTLLQHVPVKDRGRVADAGNESNESVRLSYQSIQGDVFENRVRSMLDQQLNDVGTGGNVETAVRDKLDNEPYLTERDLKLLEQAQRNSWPDWRKHGSTSDQAELARYEGVKQYAQELADWLLEDVESPQAYGRDQAQQYLTDKFGIDVDSNDIRVRAQYTTHTGPQERTGTLLEFLQDGPRDMRRGDATYSVIQPHGSGTSLTDIQLKQMLGELDVRKDYSTAVDTSYQDPEVKDALSDVLDSEIQMDAFGAKMRGHLSQSGYEVVQRMRNPAKTPASATTQVSMGGLSINLPGKGADQMKDALVFRETDAKGQVERYVLYAPNSPDSRDFYEFSNWRTLSSTLAGWTNKPEGQQYLQDQLAPENRRHAAYFFQDIALRAGAWSLDGNSTATWSDLVGNGYRAKLDAVVAEKNETRVAAAKVGGISPDWYRNATSAERQQLTSFADRVRATKQELQSNLPKKSFPEYAHEKVKGYLDDYLRTKGVTETIDPDTVMVDLGAGGAPQTLTQVVTYGYDSSVNFVSSARFSSTTKQDLSQLNASVPGHDRGAGRRGAFAEYIDAAIRGSYIGESYTKEIEKSYLTEGPTLQNRRALYQQHTQATMTYDALEAKVKGELTDAEYASVKQQIGQASTDGTRSPETRGLHRLTLNDRAVEGVYVFRGVGEVGNTRDLLYTPGAPDGRTLRPYDDTTFRPGDDEPRSVIEEMANYYDQRVKYSDQRVANTRLEALQRGKEKSDKLGTSHRVANLGREYDRKLQLMLDPVKETTKTRGQVIGEQVWKGIGYVGAVFSVAYPPAGVAFGSLQYGMEMHDAYQACRKGDRASASLHILAAGAEAVGVAFDAGDALKGLGKGLMNVRKALELKPGQHFGFVDDAAKALKKMPATLPSTASKGTSPFKSEFAVKNPPSESTMELHSDGLLNGVYEKKNGEFSTYFMKAGNSFYEIVPDFNNQILRLADARTPNARYHPPIVKDANGKWSIDTLRNEDADLSGYESSDTLPAGATPKPGNSSVYDFQGKEYVKTGDGKWRETSYENGKRYIKHPTQTGQTYEVVQSANETWSVQPRLKLKGGGRIKAQTISPTQPQPAPRPRHPQAAQLSNLADTVSRSAFDDD